MNPSNYLRNRRHGIRYDFLFQLTLSRLQNTAIENPICHETHKNYSTDEDHYKI